MLRALLRRSAVATAAAVAAVGLATAPADAVADGYYQPGYTDAIYLVVGSSARQLGYDEWVAAGRPVPKPAPTSYVKYPWSPTLYAVTFWGQAESTWQWQRLSYPQWQRAGTPAPSIAGWIAGSYLFKWGTSSELFIKGEDEVIHKLTYADWQRSGLRGFDDRADEGWAKLSWANDIAKMTKASKALGAPTTYAEWQRHDFPAPVVVTRFAGDQFTQTWTSDTITYTGPTLNRAITYPEWTAAGRPAPYLPLPEGTWTCASFPTHNQAQRFHDFYLRTYGDWAQLDANGDGNACEYLP